VVSSTRLTISCRTLPSAPAPQAGSCSAAGGIEEGDAAVLVGGDDASAGCKRQELWLGGAVTNHDASAWIGLKLGLISTIGEQYGVDGGGNHRRGADHPGDSPGHDHDQSLELSSRRARRPGSPPHYGERRMFSPNSS